MTHPRNGRELLDRLLNREPPTLDEIQAMLGDEVDEDVCLDYKRGRWLDDKKSGAARLRKWVAAFANTEGGVLVLGAADGKAPSDPSKAAAPWSITGVRPPWLGKASLREWIGRALSPFASAGVRPEVVELTRGGEPSVFLVAVDRAPRHVWTRFEGARRYFLRFDQHVDELRGAPLTEHLLGVRRVPELDVELEVASHFPDGTLPCLQVVFGVENVGLVPAEDLRCTAVVPAPEPLHPWSVEIPKSARRLVRPLGDAPIAYRTYVMNDGAPLPAFHVARGSLARLALDITPQGRLRLDLALVFVPLGSEPQTFAVAIEWSRPGFDPRCRVERSDTPPIFFGHAETRTRLLEESGGGAQP